MRVILNIDDDLFEQMKVAADIRNETVDVMLSKLFTTYLLNPAKHVEENNLDDIEEFKNVFMRYMNEQILDIEDMPKEERYKEDEAMLRAFKHLRDSLSDNSFVLTELHRKYKNTRE